MRSKIPAMCLSGGKLSEFGGKAFEYRIWIHPKQGEDKFYRTKSIENALKKRSEFINNPDLAIVEPIIAVVYDKRFKKYREVQIDGVDYS
jgi:hypothetical protein